jgi:hypothetical protein
MFWINFFHNTLFFSNGYKKKFYIAGTIVATIPQWQCDRFYMFNV